MMAHNSLAILRAFWVYLICDSGDSWDVLSCCGVPSLTLSSSYSGGAVESDSTGSLISIRCKRLRGCTSLPTETS